MKILTVLLVEDDKWLCDMYCDYLRSKSVKVLTTDDAQEAVDIMDDNSIDCLVLDMMLPRRSGVEILHEVQSYDDIAKIPKLVLSTMNPADFASSDVWEQYGVHKYLYKPKVTPSQLLNEINQAIA